MDPYVGISSSFEDQRAKKGGDVICEDYSPWLEFQLRTTAGLCTEHHGGLTARDGHESGKRDTPPWQLGLLSSASTDCWSSRTGSEFPSLLSKDGIDSSSQYDGADGVHDHSWSCTRDATGPCATSRQPSNDADEGAHHLVSHDDARYEKNGNDGFLLSRSLYLDNCEYFCIGSVPTFKSVSPSVKTDKEGLTASAEQSAPPSQVAATLAPQPSRARPRNHWMLNSLLPQEHEPQAGHAGHAGHAACAGRAGHWFLTGIV